MTIKIGDKTFTTRKPQDLEAILLANTGCDASETARHLAGYPSAGRVAAALRPFLPQDAPSTPELAHMIAAEGPDIVTAVAKLYGEPSPSVETPTGGEE